MNLPHGWIKISNRDNPAEPFTVQVRHITHIFQTRFQQDTTTMVVLTGGLVLRSQASVDDIVAKIAAAERAS